MAKNDAAARLPAWISPIPGRDNAFAVDPDLYMPEILADMGVETPSARDLELAQEVMKLDFDMALRLARYPLKPGRNIARHVRADEGRKQRWNRTMHPKGEALPDTMAERTKIVRALYRQIRGYLPA